MYRKKIKKNFYQVGGIQSPGEFDGLNLTPGKSVRDFVNIADLVNTTVASGKLPQQTDQGKALRNHVPQNVINSLIAFSTRPDLKGLNPEQRLSAFYNIQSSDSTTQDLKDRIKNLGYGALEFYRSSPRTGTMNEIAKKQAGGVTLTSHIDQAKGYNDPNLQSHQQLNFPAESGNQVRYFTPASVPVMAQDAIGNQAYLGPGSTGANLQGNVSEYLMNAGGQMWEMLPEQIKKKIKTAYIKRFGGQV